MGTINKPLRGIRDSIPPGYLLGRTGAGKGPPILIPINNFTSPGYVANTTIQVGGAAGGDLTGTYPNPTVAKLQGHAVKNAAPADGNVLMWVNGNSDWEPTSLSGALDKIGATQGDILYRDSALWKVLAPGTAGQVLTTGGAAANPSWAAAGGGSLILGSGAPSAVEPAGTLYSRTDLAALYSSQPIATAISLVQSAIQDNNSSGTPNQVTFGSAVTAGNLLVAVLYNTGAAVGAASGWTLRGSVADGTNSSMAVYTRTAAGGDGTTPPAIASSSPGTASAWMALELSGCTWANLDQMVGAGVASGSGGTTAISQTTTGNNDLAFVFAGQQLLFGGQNTVGAPYTLIRDGAFFHDQVWFGDATIASPGAVNATATWNGAYGTACYLQLSFTPTVTANWVLLSSGLNPLTIASWRI